MPLYPFQSAGVEFLLANPRALLADEPGCGKSIQTLTALKQDPNIRSVLILCPASLKFSWKDEILKWREKDDVPDNQLVQVIDGNKTERMYRWAMKKDIRYTIANYEAMMRDRPMIPTEWDAIVCDEATRIANSRTKTFKALYGLTARRKIALTGTPVQNSPLDLFGIISWLAAPFQPLGSYWLFINTYAVKEPRFNRIVGFRNLQTLSMKVKPYILRRLKAEVLTDLPPRTIQDIVFELSGPEKTLYKGIQEDIVHNLGDISKNLGITVVKMLRLKQLTGHPHLILPEEKRKDIESSKLAVLKDILEPIKASGEKVIIFTQFSQLAVLLQKEFEGSYRIDGDVPAFERQDIVNEFNATSGHRILIMTEAGAMGLNLQGASYIIHYDLPWSVGKYEQRIGRAHRIGQERPVTVYNLIAKNSIDEYCLKILKRKYKVSNDILSDDDRLEDAGMSEEDIKNILNL